MLHIRPIAADDDRVIAEIILSVMEGYEDDPSTTIAGDSTIHHMYRNYQEDRAVYYVACLNDKVAGGCGIRQLSGTEENICELQRMFLLPNARGKGIGRQLMQLCLDKARESGYEQVYIETLQEMRVAQQLYRSFGFEKISFALGNTGHCGCDVKMLKQLSGGDRSDRILSDKVLFPS